MKSLERGEIIQVNLNPTQGREQQGEARPCLVLSNIKFNQHRQGIVIVSPITNAVKPQIKTLIPLPDESKVTGSVVVEQIRTIDLSQRWCKTTSIVLSKDFVDSVTHIVNQIIS